MKAADRARWKAHELETSKILQGIRQPSNGRRQEDISHELFTVEHKERKTVPSWWSQATEQLKHSPPGKIPLIVFIHCPNIKGRKLERYGIIELEHLAAIYRELSPEAISRLTSSS